MASSARRPSSAWSARSGSSSTSALFNLLRYAGDPGVLEHKPLTAKAISVTVATIVTYLGNRHWTWAERERSGARREVTLFFVLNGIGMAIALGCLAVSHYVLDLTVAAGGQHLGERGRAGRSA